MHSNDKKHPSEKITIAFSHSIFNLTQMDQLPEYAFGGISDPICSSSFHISRYPGRQAPPGGM